jgi:tetratricopeptide (TPR) repeat protein
MRCLAKAPAERPQTAAELVPLLEGAATPSGGIAAQDPTLVSGGTQAALRRAHPVRLMATYGVAGAVALAAAWFAVQRLGLADWVFTGAVALVAAGVPVMLMTGHHERRRVLARTTAVALTPPETSVSRWFTWRRSLQGAVMGFGLLALGAGAYTGMRVLGIGPVGTLVASGKLATRERVILADFESHAADTTLGASLTEALRVDLSQSPTVRLVEAGDVARVLTQMQRSDEHGLPTALAREVAERAGVKAVVAGKIDPVGAGYVLSASLLSAADGNILVAVRETADDASGLLKAIDRLSAKLRERIGESLVTIRANPSLEQVTTASLPALKLYTEGARLVDEERNREAVRVLRGAIAIDTGFAMAYRKLAVALSNSGSSTEEVVAAATHALHLRDRLTDVERNLTEGFYYDVVEYDEARQDAAYRAVLAVDPDNLTALNNLARLRAFQRRMTETDSLASRAFRTDQNLNLALFIVRARLAEGHGAAARAAVAQIVPALAQVPGARAQIEADIALAERNDTASLRLLEAWRTAPGLDSTRLLEAERLSAWLFESHGQLREAERHLREQERIGEQTGQPWDAVAAAANRAAFEARYRGRPEAALTSIRSALDRHPLDSMPPGNWPYVDLARAYTASGRPDLARRVLTEWERRVPAAQRAAERVTGLAYGDVLAAEGKVDAAARQYADANRRMSLCGVCGLAEMAALADRAGRADSAIALYRTLIDAPAPLYRVSTESQSLAPAYKRLGELYEAKGDRKQAAAYYGRFVDLWKDADPELQPGVREVRGRLAKLAQEPGT